ncbi:MAG: protoheme IX farnesyltransferase [Bdellovibrionales bacterium]|nr:protoheme IX farnesyltransferase [Bdellovibrionales bacterium]
MISGLAGYAASFSVGQAIDMIQPILLVIGLYLVSAGSFALNQAQEWQFDLQMPRTATRPVAAGHIEPWQAYALGILFCFAGIFALYLIRPSSAFWALSTVVLYNGLYTLYWKKKWAFGAVPGAIPGAMPVVIGYSANVESVLTPECIYLFLIMFLWQMPHFWALAVRYKDDYAKGGFPVLPLRLGVERTLYHVGLYTFAYVGVAIAAPWFVNTHVFYLIIILPLALKVLWEFFKYYHSEGQTKWLPFFLWVNLSMLAFICVPVFDKWFFYFISVASV